MKVSKIGYVISYSYPESGARMVDLDLNDGALENAGHRNLNPDINWICKLAYYIEQLARF